MIQEIRIAVVDDHPLFREGVIRSLGEMDGLDIVAEGGSCEDALQIVDTHYPDVMLMDISMPGNGLEAVSGVISASPDTRVVMLTVSEAHEDISRALKLGARGYVLKGIGSQALADAVRSVATGQTYVSPSLSARLFADASRHEEATTRHDWVSELTEREKQVLNLVASGLSNKRVAIELDLHEKTVKHHMTRILAKMKVTNRTEAALALRDAAENRLIS
ncbi:MAG: response regulator transcription factor [Neorhizobium sp.]|jgi:DNA-binding NarL/FixJ family response regulator|nr:response regulator transcription factor [Neorhizobium sp.]